MQKQTKKPITNEADKGRKNMRGTVAMARTGIRILQRHNFLFNLVDNGFLNFANKSPNGWGYCVFGKVISGMDVVDKIKTVKTTSHAGHENVPVEPVVIESVIVSEEKKP